METPGSPDPKKPNNTRSLTPTEPGEDGSMVTEPKSIAISKTILAALLLFVVNRVPFAREVIGDNANEVVDLILGLFALLRLVTYKPVKLP